MRGATIAGWRRPPPSIPHNLPAWSRAFFGSIRLSFLNESAAPSGEPCPNNFDRCDSKELHWRIYRAGFGGSLHLVAEPSQCLALLVPRKIISYSYEEDTVSRKMNWLELLQLVRHCVNLRQK